MPKPHITGLFTLRRSSGSGFRLARSFRYAPQLRWGTFPRFPPPTFLRLLKLLRSFFIAAAKTSYTAGRYTTFFSPLDNSRAPWTAHGVTIKPPVIFMLLCKNLSGICPEFCSMLQFFRGVLRILHRILRNTHRRQKINFFSKNIFFRLTLTLEEALYFNHG
jgi:hypothetical protein